MSRKKKMVSINVKMTIAIGLSFFIAVVAVLAANGIGRAIIDYRYLSDNAVQKHMDSAFKSLESYIDKNKVDGADSKALKKWMRTQKNTYLFVYDNYNTYFDGGWNLTENGSTSEENMAESANDSYDAVITIEKEVTPRIDASSFEADARNRIVDFADQQYYVYIDYYGEQRAYTILAACCVVIAVLVFFSLFIGYNKIVLRRITLITEKTRSISQGNLDMEISDRSNDEIRVLADSVNTMKNSILQRAEAERAAWNANNELITSMSHDIKTPLTAIIGYLDILESKGDLTEAQRYNYIKACRDKALQLSDMSNKLFQYFLVFGKQDEELEKESFDAGILFEQILSEHCAELMNKDFQIDYNFDLPCVEVNVEIASLLRAFDNVFSNVMKYAEKSEPIKVSASQYEGTNYLVTEVSNAISREANIMESTKIGLKTCEKLCENMNGMFKYKSQDGRFTAKIIIPFVKSAS